MLGNVVMAGQIQPLDTQQNREARRRHAVEAEGSMLKRRGCLLSTPAEEKREERWVLLVVTRRGRGTVEI